MKTIKNIIIVAILLITFSACTKEEDEDYCNSNCWEVVDIDIENIRYYSDWSRNTYVLTYYVVNECSGERNQFKTNTISHSYKGKLSELIKVNTTYCAFSNGNIFTKLYN